MGNKISLREHLLALREADQRFYDERDRRYQLALELARTAQDYRDEKANELREQINTERLLYATKDEIAPLTAYVLSQQGSNKGVAQFGSVALAIMGLLGLISSVVISLFK